MKQIRMEKSDRKIYVTKYEQFRGVDMSTDPLRVESSRSPYAPNLVADAGGFPEKRLGWRTILTLDGAIHGIYRAVFGDVEVRLIHCGTVLYRWEGETVSTLTNDLADAPGVFFWMNRKLWILSNGQYLCYDGTSVSSVTGYIPTTSIRRTPAGEGVVFETHNLLQPIRYNRFIPDGVSKEFFLDETGIDAQGVTVWINGVQINNGYTVNAQAGKITFSTAPTLSEKESVVVRFSKTIAGESAKILGCTIGKVWNTGNADRVFLAGNPAHPAMDFASGKQDPTYFPAGEATQLGSDNTAIMGYHILGESLAIVKEENGLDSTVFLRSLKQTDDASGEPGGMFRIRQGISGVGAISKRSFVSLNGDPLFLSRQGIFGIVQNKTTLEQGIQNRSYFVDPALTKEENLQSAAAVEWNGMYLLGVNGNVYLLDGKQPQVFRSASESDAIYECFHWENVPASCFFVCGGTLYFGTQDGRICRFNDDDPLSTKYSDDGEAIACCFSTKVDDDGNFMRRKTLLKQGSGLMIKPYKRSSVEVYVRVNAKNERLLRRENMDIFDWNDIDFTRFAFTTEDGPQVIPFLKRARGYVTLQFILRNQTVNEGFGVLGIIKRYTAGNYVKR